MVLSLHNACSLPPRTVQQPLPLVSPSCPADVPPAQLYCAAARLLSTQARAHAHRPMQVLLVGGATRMPAIRRFVRNMTGLDAAEFVVDPDLVRCCCSCPAGCACANSCVPCICFLECQSADAAWSLPALACPAVIVSRCCCRHAVLHCCCRPWRWEQQCRLAFMRGRCAVDSCPALVFRQTAPAVAVRAAAGAACALARQASLQAVAPPPQPPTPATTPPLACRCLS